MIYNDFDKAKRIARGVMILCIGALLPFMTACRGYEDEQPEQNMVPLTFYLQTAGSQHTRAYIGDLAADPAAESTINDVKVWIYQNGICVGYSETIDASNKVTARVPQSVIGNPIDVYIIANAESAGLGSLDGSTSLDDLTNATIAVDKFSAGSPVTAVPAGGLPMSIIKKGCEINAESNPVTLETIKITRAVSKIYFAFGMYEGDFGEIVGISLEGSQIAKSERIMPVDYDATADDYSNTYWGDLKANITKTGTDATDYEAPTIIFGSTDGANDKIAVPKASVPTTQTDDDPANYTWDKWITDHSDLTSLERATQYNTDMTTKPTTQAPFVTHRIYLRESDKKLKGKIYYRYRKPVTPVEPNGATETVTDIKHVSFEMDLDQDFARNHVWIVYSYFEGGKLYVNPTVAPWTNAPELTYTLKMKTNLRLFDSWLYRYDTDEDYSDWTDWSTSHIAVSDGRVTTPVGVETVTGPGRPLRSPQIQLVTTGVADESVSGSGTFELTIDNDDFEIVQAVKNAAGSVHEEGYQASTDGVLTIPAGDNVSTFFYIVPKEDGTPANPVAKVSLFYNDPVLGKLKITFNNNALPGYSDDSSEIWVYYVTPDNYNITNKLKMYFQDYNHPLVPTSVQN